MTTLLADLKPFAKPIAIGATFLISYFVYKDYQIWRGIMIPGGLPGNIFGYFVSNILTISLRKNRRDPHSVDYRTIKTTGITEGFLKEGEIPQHEGPVPEVAKWTIPHRQVSPAKNEELVQRLEQTFKEVQAQYNVNLIYAPSKIETHLKALFVGDPTSQNEVAHIHPTDGTFHAYLCPQDSEIVLEKGWGELHPLAAKYQPSKFESVLIFAPQTQEDISVQKKILLAAIDANLERDSNLEKKAKKI